MSYTDVFRKKVIKLGNSLKAVNVLIYLIPPYYMDSIIMQNLMKNYPIK